MEKDTESGHISEPIQPALSGIDYGHISGQRPGNSQKSVKAKLPTQGKQKRRKGFLKVIAYQSSFFGIGVPYQFLIPSHSNLFRRSARPKRSKKSSSGDAMLAQEN